MVVSLESFSESLPYFVSPNDVLGKLYRLQMFGTMEGLLRVIFCLFFIQSLFLLLLLLFLESECIMQWLLKTSSVAEVYYMRRIHYWALALEERL